MARFIGEMYWEESFTSTIRRLRNPKTRADEVFWGYAYTA